MVAKRLRQIEPGRIQVDAVVFRNAGDHLEVVHGTPVPPLDGAFGERGLRVLNDFFRVEELPYAQAVTSRAGAGGVVKGKQARFKLAERVAALGTGETGGEGVLMLRLVHGSDQGKTVGQLQRCFETLGQSLFQAGLDLESIHHHVDPVLSFLVERGDVVNVIYGAIHPQPNEPLAAHGLDDLEVFSLAVTNHRGQDHQAAALPAWPEPGLPSG